MPQRVWKNHTENVEKTPVCVKANERWGCGKKYKIDVELQNWK